MEAIKTSTEVISGLWNLFDEFTGGNAVFIVIGGMAVIGFWAFAWNILSAAMPI